MKLREEYISKMFLTEVAVNHDALVDMIRNRRVVSIYYMGDKENKKGWRHIEPYAYGSDRGVKYLRAWQDKGTTVTGLHKWKFFRVDRISNVNFASTQTFNKPRPMFNDKGDKHMSQIYALADFTPPKPTTTKPKPTKPLAPKTGGSVAKQSKTKTSEPTSTIAKPSTSLVKGPGAEKGSPLTKRMKTLSELFEI